MSETKLLPCPWCGLKPQVALSFARQTYSVKCRNEKCPVQPDMSFGFEHERHAIAAWNTRALTPKQQAADVMFEALKRIAFEPLTDDVEAGDATCLAEVVRIALAALAKAGQQ